jgi:hypothetical protein
VGLSYSLLFPPLNGGQTSYFSMKKSISYAVAYAGLVWGKEMAKDEVRGAALYDSGIMMNRIMERKQVCLKIRIGLISFLIHL